MNTSGSNFFLHIHVNTHRVHYNRSNSIFCVIWFVELVACILRAYNTIFCAVKAPTRLVFLVCVCVCARAGSAAGIWTEYARGWKLLINVSRYQRASF